MMRNIVLLCVLVVACAPSILAQNRAAYPFDNFDTEQGVRVQTPPVRDVLPARRVRLTAKTSDPNRSAEGGQVVAAISTRPRLALARTNAATEVTEAPSARRTPVSHSLDGFTTGNTIIDSFIIESSRRHGVDPKLMYAIMHRESAFKQNAVSYKGARGLMQLMPATARRFGVNNIFDPRQNIDGGTQYMRFLLDTFDGDERLALAGYNAGEGAVIKYGRQIPPYSETREYVRRIYERYQLMLDPQAARRARPVSNAQVATIKDEEKPAPTYERSVFPVRLPNGQLMLHSQ